MKAKYDMETFDEVLVGATGGGQCNFSMCDYSTGRGICRKAGPWTGFRGWAADDADRARPAIR